MQRPIEFRIWDKEENSWLDTRVWHNANSFFDISKEGPVSWFRSEERFICQQFTGILDKDGKKIFEGDIVNAYIHTGSNDKDAFLVLYSEKCATFALKDRENLYFMHCAPKESLEVIGHIFENQGLLK